MTPSEMASKISSIPTSSGAILGHGSFSANGSYSAAADNLDGYDTVTVSIPMTILSTSSNGTFVPSQGGYNQVNVNVPQPTMSALSVSANGSYTADPNTGFDVVDVNVPSAALSSKTITVNGTYNAIDDSLDGYDTVTVSISGGYGQYDWYDDGVDVTVTVDDINLVTSVATTSFYDTYQNQHINTLTVNVGASTSINGFNSNPFKRVGFKKLVVGSGITNIGTFGGNAYNCMRELDIQSNDLTTVNYSIGRSCSSLVKVSFPPSASYSLNIARMFEGCSNLETITLPINQPTISNYMFSSDNRLISINLEDLSNLTSIRESAFMNCYALDVDFTKLSSLTTISSQAFLNTGVKEVKSNTLTTIGSSAFQGTPLLTEVSIPAVTTIGNSVFYGCTELEKVTLSPSLSVIPECAFTRCCNLKEINLNNITTIGSNAFAQCYKLSSVEFNNLVTISYLAFDATSLSEVVLPSTVTTIGSSCFKTNTLKTLTLYDETISIQNNSFNNVIEDIYYRGSPGKTASDLETEYATKYGSNNALKPTATRSIHYVPYEDWHTE